MLSSLEILAVEVVEIIANALNPTDILSVRLVCQDLNRKIQHHFSFAYFATVRADLTPKSLQRLQNISESGRLAQDVEGLHIVNVEGAFGRGFQWNRGPSGSLVAPLVGANLLRDILVKLVKCRSFHVDSYDEYQERDDTGFLIPGDVVGMVLSIITDTNLAVKSFTVKSTHSGSGRLETKRLQFPLCRQPQFIAAWAHLEDFILECGVTCDQYDWVLDLVSHAPRLRKLSLGFHDDSITFMERLASAHLLNQLEDLSLVSAHMTVETISKLLLQHRDTLRAISFKFVTIRDGGSWATIFGLVRGEFPSLQNVSVFWLKEHKSPGEWSRVTFTKLARYPAVPGPERRRLGDGRLKSNSRFLKPPKHPSSLIYWGRVESAVGVSYQGPAVDQFLNALAETVEAL